MNIKQSIISYIPLVLMAGTAHAGPSWEEVQEIKAEALQLTAQHAMEQQKKSQSEPVFIQLAGGRDIRLEAAPINYNSAAGEFLRVELPKPVNMLESHSGLAVIVETNGPTDPEVRLGVRIIGTNGEVAEIDPYIPLLNKWGDQTQEIYLDWAFIKYGKVEDAIAVLESVEALEFTAASVRRTPEFGPTETPHPARFTLSNLRLVDYLQGSYDPARHSWGWDGTDKKDLTLQHRVQEVSGIVARFGGDVGLSSAMLSLDMAARTQCWDGSFLDGRRGARTVVSGEYTHGFTLWGLMDAYTWFEKINHPGLDVALKIGSSTMTRREHYQEMLYRGVMSRAGYLPSEFRDDIIHGNTLIYGANRVLGFAVAMRRAADILKDPCRKKEVMDRYQSIIAEIAAEQGVYSGGFPILGEGDRYDGRGIHYDSSYTRTHMDWLVQGIQATGDPTIVDILRRYQPALEAAMDEKGTGLLPMISERGHGTNPVQLVIPDATAQVGLRYNLPVVAQWGYNVGLPTWASYEPGARINHFTWAMHARGYPLGAHLSILLFDLDKDPVPTDVGYRFPREYPIWSTRLYHKTDGALVRTSRMTIGPDGTVHNDYRIEVGEYPETIGIPLEATCPDGPLTVEATGLQGWPTLLKDGAVLTVITPDKSIPAKVNQEFQLVLDSADPVEVTITGPEVHLPGTAGGESVPFQTSFILTPSKPGQTVTLRVVNAFGG